MNNSNAAPKLTDEQQQALDDGNGVLQGETYLLMRHDVVLDWFGYTPEQLRNELQIAIDQADRGELEEWNLREFLADMHRGHGTKAE